MSGQKVELRSLSLEDVLGIDGGDFKLKIPEYQRIYCWEEKHVFRLLEDINLRIDAPYHLGTIILHKKPNNEYDIVDGQQRLVTLTLLLLLLDNKIDFPLSKETFTSTLAENYIAYNKWLIQNYLKKPNNIVKDSLLKNLRFSVLILESSNLDLAYTFFSSENGKGKSLTDYDLLKSHHLRYIYIANQAEHLAERWDDMIRNDNQQEPLLPKILGLHLFRLRKWMRKRNWDDGETRKVKNHFEAAPTIPDIPPFGEQFHFYETIQGGAHFFAFVEHFITRFKEFYQLEFCKQLHRLYGERHWWYRDVIEGLLFAYYLKFGQQYILSAFDKIIDLVSHHRYVTIRTNLHSIFHYVSDSEIVMMIDQATSPTFFLAEMKKKIDILPYYEDFYGTRKNYKTQIDFIKNSLGLSITN